jgi:ubiquitin carboxyl-terminal hydrolase 36/42
VSLRQSPRALASGRFASLPGLIRSLSLRCNKLVVASKGLSITKAPQALMVQLRRFTPTGGKLNDVVSYDRTFDITPYMAAGAPGARYSLYAVVCHSGSGPHSGHYTSRVLSTDSKTWHVMDDSSVYPLNGGGSQPPLGLREAYLLMYIREKGAKLDEAIGAVPPAKVKKQQQQQQQAAAAASAMPSPAPSSPAARQALAAAAAVGQNGNKKRRISEIPAEADRTLPSPPATSDDEAEYDDDEAESSSNEDGEDVGRPATVLSGPLRLNAPLVARSNKKARRDDSLPTPSVTPSAAASTSSTASSAASAPASSASSALPQGLGPRPFGFGGAGEKKDGGAGGAAPNQKRRRDGSGPGGKKQHGGHRRGVKDPYGLSMAGKGGHKLKKGLVRRMGGRPS